MKTTKSNTWRIPKVFIWNFTLHRLSSSMFLRGLDWNVDAVSFPFSTNFPRAAMMLAAVRELNFSSLRVPNKTLASVAVYILRSRSDWTQGGSWSSVFSSVDLICWTGGTIVDVHFTDFWSNRFLLDTRTRHSLKKGTPRNMVVRYNGF